MPQYYRKLSKGIRWYWKFDYNGKTYHSPCIFISKKEASQSEREKHNQLDEERRYGKQDKPLFLGHMIDDRIHYLKVKYSHGHSEDSKYYLTLFFNYIGNKEIRDISKKEIEDFLLDYSNQLKKKGIDNYQVNAALKCIKSLFNYVIDSYDLIIRNPSKNIKPYSVIRSLKYIPPESEIEKVRGFLNFRQQLLFDFVMETGCRINEALALTFEDITDTYLILYTRKSKNSDRVPRKAEIPNCLKGITGIGRVFPEWNDTPKFLDKTLRANKMRVWGWHSLRHRYASILSKSGEPIFSIMSKLGHSNLSTTQKYIQLLS